MTLCPLCLSEHSIAVRHQSWSSPSHLLCHNCDLIFLLPKLRLDLAAEKRRYETHHNDIQDPQYRHYLQSFLGVLDQEWRILDFGCGATPALASLLQEQGFRAESFDPVFGPPLVQPKTEVEKYDVIFAIEVVEHFFMPRTELEFLASLLKKAGQLRVVTQWHQGADAFFNWWYARDPTHVVFYSSKTIRWIDNHMPDLKGKLHWHVPKST